MMDFCDCGYPGIRKVVDRTRLMTDYDIDRYNGMFEYSGSAPMLNTRLIERALMRHGCVAIAPHDGNLYALWGGAPGGELDHNYQATRYIGANPHIGGGWDYDLRIGEECVLIRNDIEMRGLLPLLSHHNFLRATNELSMYMAMINSRLQAIIEAGNDADAEAVRLWFDDLENGKLSAVVGKNILQKIGVMPYGAKTEELTDLIEMEQYHKAAAFNDLGLSANYNMKREAINSNEAQMAQGALMPLVQHMLEMRQEGWAHVNDLFGSYLDAPVTVTLADIWRTQPAARTTPTEEVTTNDAN